jgi:hypothetical protein
MKKLFSFLALLALTFSAKSETVIQCMNRVNHEVLKQHDLPSSWSTEPVKTANFNEAIQLHLSHVIQVLSARNTSALSPSQQANREHLLSVLASYGKAGKFPINEHAPYQTPVFIDHYNTHCAVGYLMEQSGAEALAQEICRKQNLAYVREIQVNGVTEWAKLNGFTVDELAWIQPGYPPTTSVTPLLNGTNNDVYDIINLNGELIAAGAFTQADNQPAAHIASYISGFAGWLWTETSGGTNGPVYALDTINHQLIAAGNFSQAGTQTVSNVAQMQDGNWIPMGSAINGTVYDLEWHEGTLYAAGNFTLSGGSNLAKWNGSEWVALSFSPNAPVRCLKTTADGLIYGGEFTQSGSLATNHIGKIFSGMPEAIGNGIGTIVYDVENWNNKPTAAGAFKENGQVYGMMQFNSGNWQSLPGMSEIAQLDTTGVIYSIKLMANVLYAGGDFDEYDLMTFGKNLMKWSSPDEFPTPIAVFDSTVYCLYADQDILYAGGSFTHHLGSEINHIAQLGDLVGIEPNTGNPGKISAFPVPSGEDVNVQNAGPDMHMKLYSIQGKLIQEFLLKKSETIHLPAAGVYILQADNGEQLRLVRQ